MYISVTPVTIMPLQNAIEKPTLGVDREVQ